MTFGSVNSTAMLSASSQLIPPALIRVGAQFLLRQIIPVEQARSCLGVLEGRWLSIDCKEMPYPLRITMRQGLLCSSTLPGKDDARIQGNLTSFISLIRRECDPDTLFFQRLLVMEGDTELALTVKNFLDSLDLSALPFWLRLILAPKD